MLTTLAGHLAHHPRRTLLLTLLFVAVAGIFGGPVAGMLSSDGDFAPHDAGSQRAIDRIEAASGQEAAPGVLLLVRTPRGAGAPASLARVAGVRRALAAVPGIAVTQAPAGAGAAAAEPGSGGAPAAAHGAAAAREGAAVAGPGSGGATARGSAAARDAAAARKGAAAAGPGSGGATARGSAAARDGSADPLVARDGRAALITGTLTAAADDGDVVSAVTDRFAGQADVAVGGPAVANEQVSGRVGKDLGLAEAIAFPLLLVLSLLFFRGRAALLPVVLGVTTVLGTFLVLRGVNAVHGLSIFALNLVIGLGLGLAVDYSLFLVTRFREELAPAPDDVLPALTRTLQTAGRTVLFSAATVAAALITLTLFPLNFLQSMGIAGAVVAGTAAVAALIVTPALFALWGARLLVTPRGRGGAWYRLSHAVMRRPGTIALATAAVMLVAAAPALRAHFTPIDGAVIPKAESARTVADALPVEFPRLQSGPVTVALDGDAAGVAARMRGFAGLPGVARVTPAQHLGGSTWRASLIVAGDPQGAVAQRLVRRLRSSEHVLVSGGAAAFVDQQAAIASRLPAALALLALLTVGVLWLMTGSVVLPLKALVMNALTVGASLGALTLVYQDGRFEGLLGYTGNGGIEPTDFLVSAALIFALSTDYGVFLLGRIKEARESGRSEREAVAVGLERTGRVVTAAAILLAVAIGAFATSSISFIQQIGVATAVGVLLDAFVVRALFVPALMGLLGGGNWWSPVWLRRVHGRLGGLEGAASAPRAPVRAAAVASQV